MKSTKKRIKTVKSEIHFLNDFFVQNGYFRSKDDGEKDKNPSKQTK